MTEAISSQPPAPGVELRPAMTFAAPPKAPKGLVDMQAGAGRAPPPSDSQKAAVMAERQRQWEANDAGGVAVANEEAKPQPYEHVDFVITTLPSGKVVEYGPRPRTNLSWDVADILGEQSVNQMLTGMVRTALCVRSIDGRPVARPGDLLMAKKVMNEFDERDTDCLFGIHNATWPPLRRVDLPAVQKIFR